MYATRAFVVAACLFPVALAGCASRPLETALPTPGEPPPRKPDGVVLDVPAARPEARMIGDSRGVLTLAEPIGPHDAARVLDALVRANLRENIGGVVALLADDASHLPIFQGQAVRNPGRAGVLELFVGRFGSLDYSKLVGQEVLSPSEIRVFPYEQLNAFGDPARPSEMRPGDLFVLAHPATTRWNGDRYFADTIVVVLRRTPAGVRIVLYADEWSP